LVCRCRNGYHICRIIELVAVDRGGSKFTKAIAVITKAFNCAMFFFALPILNEPQVYLGIAIFLISTVAFIFDLVRNISKA
jgi:hypothetical protein